MPEMLEFFGGTFRVQTRIERACDTVKWGVRRIPDAVMLDDLRTGDGGGHAGCQAGCRLFWKEAWLRPASEQVPATRGEAYAERWTPRQSERGDAGLDRRRADLPLSGDALVWCKSACRLVEHPVVPQRVEVRKRRLLGVLQDHDSGRFQRTRPTATRDSTSGLHAARSVDRARRSASAGPRARGRWFRFGQSPRSHAHSTPTASSRACGSIAKCFPIAAGPFR